MTRLIAITLVATVIFLGLACGGPELVETPPPSPSPIGIERSTAAPMEEPATPAPEPVPTATSAPAPTATLVPTHTPTTVDVDTSPASVPAPTATSAPAPVPATVTVAAVLPADTPTPASYNSNDAMFDIFPEFSRPSTDLEELLDEVVAENDQSLVPFLMEISRFMPTSGSSDLIGQALRDLTGQNYDSDDWEAWMDWVGQNRDQYEPPSEYVTWKADFYAAIDPRMADFIRPAREFSRIDLIEIVWGGVRTDGIPDLLNPRTITPAEADYMWPWDRVLGLHINGESKAYPLRIVNAHEMVNDTVGGEPISLMW